MFKIRKLLSFTVFLFFLGCIAHPLFANNTHAHSKPITIGILVPLDHVALREIVAGFKEVVSQQYPNAIFNVQNAQGDIKLMRSIIELFVGQQVDIVVPVGTMATQMALSHVKQQPIISLAADYSEKEEMPRKNLNVAFVLDEIGGKKKIDFMKQLMPDTKKISLIFHNGNEKNFKEVNEIIDYGKKQGVEIQKLSINTLPELETAVKAIDQNSQAILVLKDHLIVSGIPFIIPEAKKRHIPLITSDEGSVKEGASLALGVRERDIGEEGGKLAIKILQHEDIKNLPAQRVNSLTIFYNTNTLKTLHLNPDKLKEIAQKNQYDLMPIK